MGFAATTVADRADATYSAGGLSSQQLRYALGQPQIKQGETFQTQTDTEVIPKLCKVVYDRAKLVDCRVSFFEVPPPPPSPPLVE